MKYKKHLEKKYCLEFIDKILQNKGEFNVDRLKKFKDELQIDKVASSDIMSNLIAICNELGMEIDTAMLDNKFAAYCKLKDERNSKANEEQQEIKNVLDKIDASIKNSVHFVDNNILPYMSAVLFHARNRLNT